MSLEALQSLEIKLPESLSDDQMNEWSEYCQRFLNRTIVAFATGVVSDDLLQRMIESEPKAYNDELQADVDEALSGFSQKEPLDNWSHELLLMSALVQMVRRLFSIPYFMVLSDQKEIFESFIEIFTSHQKMTREEILNRFN